MEEVKPVTLKPGYASIKQEFLKPDHKLGISTEFLSKDVKEKLENENKRKLEADSEGSKLDGGPPASKKMKLKGRNKHRPVGHKTNNADKLCPAILHEQECRFGDNCKFSHAIQQFMSNKPTDLGPDCHIFETFGICRYGIACRYGSKHITENYKNITNEELAEETKKKKFVTNVLEKDLQQKLWKKKYDFEKANKNSSRIQKEVKAKLDAVYDNRSKVSRQSDLEKHKEEHKIESNAEEKSKVESDSVTDAEKDKSLADSSSVLNKVAENSQSNLNGTTAEAESSISKSGSDENCCQNTDTVSSELCESGSIESAATETGQSSHATTVTDGNTTVNQDIITDNTRQSHHNKTALDAEGIKLRPQEKKLIDFSKKLYLAPLTTVGNLPFRRICKLYGADITCGEMALATNILQGQQSEWALLKRHASEDLFGVQICGAWPDTLTRCCHLINSELDVDFVDLNCGCPIDLVFKKGEGCALMGKSNKFEQVVRSMKSVLDIPLTVKMRTGIYDDKKIAHYLIPKLRDWGASLVTLHGRSREQRYTREADWDYINQCAKLASPMPVFGNGDVLSYEDWNSHLENTSVDGCMIARGALIKPWIFREIKEQRHWDISAGERLDMLKTFVNNGLEHWGSDQQGVENTRRFLLEWLSFLYRYIPVGVLEQVPQKINERPPYYVGRSDLETLLSSANCGDWIKISEMLLGPVPDGFNFLPKHKANAYK